MNRDVNNSSNDLYHIFYNPDALNVTAITIWAYPGNAGFGETGKVYGSNDNGTWDLIANWSTSDAGQGNNFTISMSSNGAYYKYYKLKPLTSKYTSYWGCWRIIITATYLEAGEPDYWNAVAMKDKSAWFIKY